MEESNDALTITIKSDLWDAELCLQLAELAQTSNCLDGTSIGEECKQWQKEKSRT